MTRAQLRVSYGVAAAWAALLLLGSLSGGFAADEVTQEMTVFWSAPRFAVRDLLRVSDGSVIALVNNSTKQGLALQVGLDESGPGREIELSIDATRLGRDLHLRAGSGNTFWIGGGANFSRTLSSGALSDAYLAKLDGAGNIVWQRTFGRDRRREIQDIASLDGGDALVVGIDDDQTWLARISTNGEMVWEKTFGLAQAASIAQIGAQVWVAAFDKAGPSIGNGRVTLWRFDNAGELVGKSVVREEVAVRPHLGGGLAKIVKNPQGTLYIFSGWDEGLRPPKPVAVTKLDISGEVIWEKALPSTILHDPPHRDTECLPSIAVLENGDAIVACPDRGRTDVSQIDARTAEVTRTQIAIPEMQNCEEGAGGVRFFFERDGQGLRLFGGGRGCTWLGGVLPTK